MKTMFWAFIFIIFAPLVFAASVVGTIDSSADLLVETGEHHALALRKDYSVVAYNVLDRNNDNILTNQFNLAYCVSDCTTNPQYSKHTIVNGVVSLGGMVKLVINAQGNPYVAYYEGISTGNISIATCIGNCYSSTPTYRFVKTNLALPVRPGFDLALSDNRPVFVYGNNVISLAYCIQSCDTPTPIFFEKNISTNLGKISKLVLKIVDGNPVIAYERVIDWGYTKLGFVGLIYCTQDCYTATGQYQTYTLAHGTMNTKSLFDMAIDSLGRPVVSYAFDDGLSVAKCLESCYSPSPTYQHAMIDKFGSNPSLTIRGGNYPIMSYYNTLSGAQNLKYAVCLKDCDTATPVYRKRTLVDQYQGWESSNVKIRSGKPVITFFDGFNKDLKVVHCDYPGCGP